MQYSYYHDKDLKCSDAQFALAIALSFLDEKRASAAVLTYLGTRTVPESQRAAMTLKREEFESIIAKSKLGTVPALIEFFAENKVLDAKNASSRTYTVKSLYTLTELLTVHSLDEVYQKTMSLCLSKRADEFILLFMDTSEYFEIFSKDVSKAFIMSADKFRRNDLSTGVIDEILEDFKARVHLYSTNGTYDAATCTPVAFLRSTFSFYKMSAKSTELYNILNKRGQDVTLSSDDGTTALDLVGIEDTRNSVAINFIPICSKIWRASNLLFKHGSCNVAFYDIFSYHRDLQLASIAQDNLKVFKKRLHGCNINYNYSTSYDISGDQNSINSKKAGRIAICNVLENIISDGLSKKDIFSYYIRILHETDKQLAKNGARLFSTRMHTTRHLESNGNMLQILINGYLALRELLLFFDSKDNVYGVTANNFPTLIFRDEKYLRRFKTLEEYINYIKDVSCLCNEVEGDQNRKATEIDGIYNNDTVYDIMSSKKMLNDSIFCALRDMPLSYIKSAVSAIADSDKDADLYSDILQMKKCTVEMYPTPIEQLDGRITSSYVAKVNLLKVLGTEILNMPIEDLRNCTNLHYCIQFCNCLKDVMGSNVENHPVCDNNDAYLLTADLIRNQFDYMNESIEDPNTSKEVSDLLKNSMILRVVTLHKIYYAFTGIDKSADYSCSWEDLHTIFCVSTLYEVYLSKLFDVFGGIIEEYKDLYLILVKLARYPELLRLPQVATSCSTFSFLYTNDTPQYKLYKLHSASECVAFAKNRDKSLIEAYNTLSAQLSEQFNLFERISIRIDQCMPTSGHLVYYDPVIENLLTKANYSILGSDLTEIDVNTGKAKLSALSASFDYLNYLTISNKRYCFDSRYYYHKEGVCVQIDRLNKAFRLIPIDDSAINRIIIEMNWGMTNGTVN